VVAATDPTLDAWRAQVAALGGRLVDLESDTTVAVARSGVLTGGSATAWAEADAGIAAAWETYRTVDELLDRAAKNPAKGRELLTGAHVPAPPGETGSVDATTGVRAAVAAVDRAEEVTHRLAAAWGDFAARIRTSSDAAKSAGDVATTRSADAVANLLASDPLAVTEADVAAVEASAARSAGRRRADQAAVGRFDVDMTRARSLLAGLTTDAETAATELAHAASRIAGVQATVPVADLPGLGAWLDRIADAANGDRAAAAGALQGWFAAAEARRAELDAALTPARDGMRRRDDGRGLWTALRAKAGSRHLDEQPDVVAALDAAKTELWQAPCDLGRAEAALTRLSAVLEQRPGGTNDSH
jgi:hypothetical protein